MNAITLDLINTANSTKESLVYNKEIAHLVEKDDIILNFLDDSINTIDKMIEIVSEKNLKTNYINQFKDNINSILNQLSYRVPTNTQFVTGQEFQISNILHTNKKLIDNQLKKLKFKIDFFKTVSFFDNNIVVVGANGSGKTSISQKFKELMSFNGVVISAQRILLIPAFDSISNPTKTYEALRKSQNIDKTNKDHNSFNNLQDEFKTVLRHLLAENIAVGNSYRKKALEASNKGESVSLPPTTDLDKTLDIWNLLITHRKIECVDGMNISIVNNNIHYPAIQMSDGEKVTLFLIAQVLQAPKDGFIIVDEPEMYLHKTILIKLWDNLERQRPDCIFIYLTHDLDFATSRVTAKKIWIKSFTYPDSWDMESIPENELPESLLMELLGSRKNILFCEGEKGSIDEKIYNILFPNYTIVAVGGCFEVINHTKAFNKIKNINIKALGLIDSDHHPPERLTKLKAFSIYHFKVAEVENLLLNETFLKKLALKIMVDVEAVEWIMYDILKDFKEKKEIQASNYVSSQIDYYFKDVNLIKGNSVYELKRNFETFTKEINIDDSYNKRIKELDNIIESSDYSKVISIYNNKGIKKYVEKHFKITDFTNRAIKLLQEDSSTHVLILNYFPDELK